MKPLVIVLALSLTGNLILAGACLWRKTNGAVVGKAVSPGSAGATTGLQPKVGGTEGAAAIAEDRPAVVRSAMSRDRDWSALFDPDPAVFARKLREAGFPPAVARDLVAGQLTEVYRAKFAEVAAEESTPYWTRRTTRSETRSPLTRLLFEYDEQYSAWMWGPDSLADDPEAQEQARWSYGNLPVNKLQRVRAIDMEYHQRLRKLSDGSTAREQRDQNKKLLDEWQQTALKDTLTAEELRDYELRQSSTAKALRSIGPFMKPTEAEYLAVFAIEKNFEDVARMRREENTTPAQAARRAAYEAELKSALGEARYAEYAHVTQFGADQLTRLISRLELPLNRAAEINRYRDDLVARARVIDQTTALSSDQRAAQLRALAAEAKTALATKLGGERGYTLYGELKGEWLRALEAGKVLQK